MKKLIAMLLALTVLACLTACGGAPNTDAPQTTGPADNSGASTEANTQQPAEGYSFTLEDVELLPGADFDPAQLPEAASVYEVPSCALEGTDNVYNYETVEVTAYDDGNGEIIYSVFIVDANTPTDEGLYIGDTMEQVNTIYGTDRTENGTQLTYQKGNTMLVLIVENDTVTSIEYRAVTE
jgi:hypothetical protein